MADRLEGRFGPAVFVSQAEYDAMVASGRVDSGVLYAICEEVPVASWADDGTVRFPAECGCVVAVTLEEPPLSRDEVERGCDRNDAEVSRAEIVVPCPAHGGVSVPVDVESVRVDIGGVMVEGAIPVTITDEFLGALGPAWDRGGPVAGQGVIPPGSSRPEVRLSEEQRAVLRRMGVDEGDIQPGSDPLGARRAAAFTDSVASAREAIEAEARRQVLADAAVREKVLRARMGAAIAAGLEDQASRHQGFRCDTTSNRDMFAVAGILTVSELVESVVKALSDG